MPPHMLHLGNCWLWTAAVSRESGYGVIMIHNPMHILAHRLSWILHFGEVPEGLRAFCIIAIADCVFVPTTYLSELHSTTCKTCTEKDVLAKLSVRTPPT
jgi:hypothetical protein